MGKSKDKNKGLPDAEFNSDLESSQEKLPYPKSVFFIVINEFCERFSYYGMKAVLTLYLNNVLGYSEDTATVIYHIFSMFAYFTPILGAMLADSLLGKFKTIFYLSIVYAAGNIVLALAATPPISGAPDGSAIWMSMLGLGLIALGTGGIKPCVAAFGGDQFVLPQQATQLVTFFSFFYMAINSGSLISTAITPVMRSSVQCFDQDSCYTLAFAVPAALMIVALLVFLAGKVLYRETKPSGNVVVKVCKCIGHAISRKRKSHSSKEHWLDHADDTYDQRFIEDVKIVLRVLVLYLPIPLFWALFDQQGSRWTLQATRLNGFIGSFRIEPDQIQVLNPALILLFIPLFDNFIYPALAKCNMLKRPLQRLTVGGVLAGVAFIVSGVLELQLEKGYPTHLDIGKTSLNFVNTLPCRITLNMVNMDGNHTIEPNDAYLFDNIDVNDYYLYTGSNPPQFGTSGIEVTVPQPCGKHTFSFGEPVQIRTTKPAVELKDQDGTEEAEKGGGFTYLFTYDRSNEIRVAYGDWSDDREKPKKGNPKVRFLLGGDIFRTDFTGPPAIPKGRLAIFIDGDNDDHEVVMIRDAEFNATNYGVRSNTTEVKPIDHTVTLVFGGEEQGDLTESIRVVFPKVFDFKLGASYIVSITRNGALPHSSFNFTDPASYKVVQTQITEESSLSIVWLLPQYIIITAAEIMFSITGLEFSYSQSPVSMKSVMQSAWLLTVAFGNLIVIVVASGKFFQEQSKEFFLFAGLMFVDMIIFAFMAYRYVPAVLEDPNKKKEEN